MFNGAPCFPGVRDIFDQLDKIFRVVGTPTDDIWPGVSSLPNYKPHKLCYYPPPARLGEVWPRLVDVPFAESLATLLLQQKAQKRIGADQALRHRYFAELPHKIFELDDGKLSHDQLKTVIEFCFQRSPSLACRESTCGPKIGHDTIKDLLGSINSIANTRGLLPSKNSIENLQISR